MRKLKLASAALLVVATTGLLFGSMGFSSVAADRGVSVAVAGDDSALVGYDTEDQTITGDERVALVTVENRLSSSATITNVSVSMAPSDGTVRVADISTPESIPTGEERTVDAAVGCVQGADATLTVSVTVEADGVTAAISGDTATRTFEVRCADQETQADASDVRFAGWGNVHFDGWSEGTLNVTYWVESSDGFEAYDLSDVDATKHIKKAIDGEKPQTGFVAVYVEESDTTYVNPKFAGEGDELVVDGKQAPSDD